MPELPPAPAPLLPPLALAAFLASVAGAAALAHCAILAALLKCSKTGLFSIIMQLTVADIILLGTTIGPELWSLNSRIWPFEKSGCVAYQGLSVFTATLSTYLVVAIALHTLTTIRIEEKVTERRMKRNSRGEDEEIRSSQHSLVANSDSSTPPRTMNVDYREAVADTRVPVALPASFVWILALSLSVPEFTLATVIHVGRNISFCTLDSTHLFNVNLMLAIFVIFLPLFIITTAGAFIIGKLSKKKSPGIDSSESEAVLKLSLYLMCVQVLLCAPRSVVRVYAVYSSSINENKFALDFSLKDDTIALINLALSSAYLTATLIRPMLCILTLPQLRKIFSFNTRTSDDV